jgi:peptidoglycan/LPS O-acetylase OafA/YrhL
MKNSTIRTDLQYLRAFSVIAVVAYHANQDFFRVGYIGVDFFFCISGFVLAPKFILIAKEADVGRIYASIKLFILDRFKRLYPAMLLCIALMTPLITLTLPTGKYLEKALTQAQFALFSSANLSANSLVGDYFDPSPNPFLHLWSLGAEWQLYVFFAFTACVLTLFKSKNPQRLFLVVSFFLVLVSLAFFLLSSPANSFSYYNPWLRLWEFGIGIFAFFLSRRFPNFDSMKAMYFILIFLLVFILVPFEKSLSRFETVLLLLLFIPFTLFSKSSFSGNSVVLWVASRSYSIYLYHWIFFVIVKHSTLNIFEEQDSKALLTFGALVLTLVFADISYRYFEKPSPLAKVSLKSKPLILVTIVFAVLVPLDSANARGFWGFNNLNSQPKYAGDADPNCDRTAVIEKPCTYLKHESAPTLHLVGDSHAAALASALVVAGEQLRFNVKVWSYKGCKYLDPRILSKSKSKLYSDPNDNCFRRDSAFREYIASHPEDIVFGAWRSQDCESNEFLGFCGIPFVELQLNSYRELASQGNRVIVFTPVPEFKDLKFFAPRSLLQSEYQASDFEFKEKMLFQAFLDEDYMIAHSDGLTIISSESILCKASLCTRKEGDEWLYRDTNHLSVQGANLFIPQIIQALQFQ